MNSVALPDPSRILVAIPSLDRRIDMGTINGLFQCAHLFAGPPHLYGGNSDIALTRNEIAHRFVEERTDCDWFMEIDSDIEFTLSDWLILWEGNEDIVTSAYAKKKIGEPPSQLGLGFTRVHRSVFERMRDLRNDDGTETVPVFYHKGKVMRAYYTTGPSPDSRWVGEDNSFYFRAGLIDASYRIETRTRLNHIGPFPYGYPQQIPEYSVMTEQGAN